MGSLTGWEDSYYMHVSTGRTNETDWTFAEYNPSGGTYGALAPQMFPTNHPVFDLNKGIISARKATGRSYMMNDSTTDIERTPGTIAPATTVETDVDTAYMFIPFLTMFQTGTACVDGASSTQTFNIYTGATVGYYANLLRKTESGQSHEIIGGVARSITISGEEGDAIKCSVEWAGADMSTGVTTTTLTSWDTGESLAYLLFQDLSLSGETVGVSDCVGFEITMTNNVVIKHYNDAIIQRFIMGDFEVSGTFRVPWSSSEGGQNEFINRLIAGMDTLFYLYWGAKSPASTGDLCLTLNVDIDTATTSGGEDEAVTEVAFIGIYDATTAPISIAMRDGINRSAV